jgi:nucleotide-binding universal stress UspA family protein
MTIRTILALLDGKSGSRAAIHIAAAIGRIFGAEVRALHVRAEPLKSLPMMGDPMAALSVPEVLQVLTEAADRIAHQAHETFNAEIPENERASAKAAQRPGSYSALWIEARHNAEDVALHMARLSDLIVLVRPLDGVGTISSPTFEAMLFESGRGVLVMPAASRQAAFENVAIAWNGSRPAVHAVQAAMPLLGKAAKITVLSGTEGGRVKVGAEELVDYLAAHGVSAKAKNFVLDVNSSGRQLLELTADSGADILVMGGYGHSRLKEFALGGATRDVLTLATLPVLMAH